ncbi:MAG: SNF2-related protein [Specibacter sp.]
MDLSLVPYVEYTALRGLVGPAAVHRGLEYAGAGKVSRVQWVESRLELQAWVSGSGRRAYETTVTFIDAPKGAALVAGYCSCPVGGNCKHVAALVFTTNRLLEETEPPETSEIPGVRDVAAEPAQAVAQTPALKIVAAKTPAAKKSAATAPAVKKQVPKKPAPWEQQLEALLHPPVVEAPAYWGREPARNAGVVAPIPMALQFELLEEPQDPYAARSQFRKNAKTRGAKAVEKPRVRLGVRPVMRNDANKWVVGNLAWDSMHQLYYMDGFNLEHKKWLQVFHSLFKSTRTGYGTGKWICLDDFNSPLLWNLLTQAAGIGLEFVTSRKSNSITWAESVHVSTDIAATADGGITLVPHAVVGSASSDATSSEATPSDGATLDPAMMGTLGAPVHGLFWWTGGNEKTAIAQRNINFAPVAESVGKTLKLLIDTRTPVEIPASARQQFLDSYYPQLRHSMDLHARDGGSGLPEIRDPELVLTAVHIPPAAAPKVDRRRKTVSQPHKASGPALELHWHWEYAVGDSTTKYSMVSDGAGHRDDAFETRLLTTVAEALAEFPAATRESFPHAASLHPGSNEPVHVKDVAAARFSTEALPALAELEHVRVDTAGTAPDYTELTGTPQIGISTKGTGDGDWFDLGVSVTLDETDIPFGELFRALASDEDHLMLPNGHYFALNQPEFEQLRRLIDEARSLQEPGGSLKISRYQAGLWEELKELATTAEQADAWQKSVSGLLEVQEVAAVPVPAGLDASLRPYQQEGFNWLAFLFDNNLGGVLADDMGLGKTLQTLALITHAKATAAAQTEESLPFLVVAPTSVVSNWAAEARRFAPGLNTTAVTDTLRKSGSEAAALVGGTDVVITSYTLFRLDNEAYASQKWAGLIFDEAQFVKNHLTKASQLARSFPASFKLAITGTPMENNLMELWSLFAITSPGLFPSPTHFSDYYRKPVEKEGDADRLKQLRRRIRPLIMRRTKDAVAKELPPKQEQVLELELAPRHRTIYQRHLQHERQKVLGLLGDMDKNRFTIFKSLTTLRMLSLDASLVDPKYASAPSSKLDVLFEQLEDVVAEGHRALIFSQFTSFLGKARERLDDAGIEYAYLDGKTRKRGEVIDKFKSGAAPVFLISLKSGGFGLNLTEADYCFLLDPWWNPATENQAVDRTHRIGQTKNVMVYRLVAKDTIEEKVMALKDKKAKLFSSVMDDDAMFSSAITADDVRGLFDA